MCVGESMVYKVMYYINCVLSIGGMVYTGSLARESLPTRDYSVNGISDSFSSKLHSSSHLVSAVSPRRGIDRLRVLPE